MSSNSESNFSLWNFSVTFLDHEYQQRHLQRELPSPSPHIEDDTSSSRKKTEPDTNINHNVLSNVNDNNSIPSKSTTYPTNHIVPYSTSTSTHDNNIAFSPAVSRTSSLQHSPRVNSSVATYIDIISIVAANGYKDEMRLTLPINKDLWYRDELMWSIYVNQHYGDQQKTHLLWRILRHDVEGVRYLLRCGAQVNYRCGIELSSTPLLIACMEGNVDIVKLLVGAKADLTVLAIYHICRIEGDLIEAYVEIPHIACLLDSEEASAFNERGYVRFLNGQNDPRINPPATTVPNGMGPLYWLLYGYHYYNIDECFDIPPLLLRFKNRKFQYTINKIRVYGSGFVNKVKGSSKGFKPQNQLRNPKSSTKDYQQILRFISTSPSILKINYKEIFLIAINMRCYDVIHKMIDLGAHYAMCSSIDCVDGPSAVLMAAYLATVPAPNTAHTNADATKEIELSKNTNIKDNTLDEDMVAVVRRLCMSPIKPIDPRTNKYAKYHHCFIAATLLNLNDVIQYIVEEAKVNDIELMEPIDEILNEGEYKEMNTLSIIQGVYNSMGHFCNRLFTAFHIAVFTNNIILVERFMKEFPTYSRNLEARNRWKSTILHWVCTEETLPLIHILSTIPSLDFNTKGKHGTAFMNACAEGKIRAVNELLGYQHRFDINSRNEQGETALYLACDKIRLDVVKRLCQEPKVDMNIKNAYGHTALMVSCEKGNLPIIETLLQYPDRYDINSQNVAGMTALVLACIYNKVNIVKRLCQEPKVDMNIEDLYGRTALMLSCEGGYLPIVEVLLQYQDRYDINCQDSDGFTALHLACNNNHVDVVKRLCQDPKLDMTKKNVYAYKALMIGCDKGYLPIVEVLLQYQDRYDINCQDNDGFTALHLACNNNHVDVVKRLCQEPKVDVTKKNVFAYTALMIGCDKGYLPIVEVLLQYQDRYDINFRNNMRQTALYLACENNHFDIVKRLCQEPKVDMSLKDVRGFTALMVCCEKGYLPIVELLLQYQDRYDINSQNNQRYTALHEACRKNHVNIVKRLCKDSTLNMSLKDLYGNTALMICHEKGYLPIAEELLQYQDRSNGHQQTTTMLHSACYDGNVDVVKRLCQDPKLDMSLKDKHGNTALMIGCEKGYLPVVEVLLQYRDRYDINIQDSDGFSALHLASYYNHVDVVKRLCQAPKLDMSLKDKRGYTALMVSCEMRYLPITEVLLQHE